MKSLLTITFTYFISSASLVGQIEWPALSHQGHIIQKVGYCTITVDYERPSVRGRKIFDGLVPFGKVWRTGAGPSTKISFDKDVTIGGQHVPAGKYALLSIPNEEQWIIIFNSDTSLYGSYGYDQNKDIARFLCTTQKISRFYETLNIDIDIVPNNAMMYISWANTQISFLIDTNTDIQVENKINTLINTSDATESDEYSMAADYYLYQQKEYSKALRLADMSIALEDNGWNRNIKTSIYERLQLYEQAIKEINLAIELEKARIYENEEYRTAEIAVWEKRKKDIESKLK